MTLHPEEYLLLNKLHTSLKKIQQLSWNINQFEKRYPFDQIDKSFGAYTSAYQEFLIELKKIQTEYDKDYKQLENWIKSAIKTNENQA